MQQATQISFNQLGDLQENQASGRVGIYGYEFVGGLTCTEGACIAFFEFHGHYQIMLPKEFDGIAKFILVFHQSNELKFFYIEARGCSHHAAVEKKLKPEAKVLSNGTEICLRRNPQLFFPTLMKQMSADYEVSQDEKDYFNSVLSVLE